MAPRAFPICFFPGDLLPSPGHADWDNLVTPQIEPCTTFLAGGIVRNAFSG